MIGICWILLVGFIIPYLVYFPALFWIISNLRGKTLKVQGTLGNCISYVEKSGILELWYKKLNNEETSYQGKLYNTRQVKAIKLRLKIADCGGNVWSRSKRHVECGSGWHCYQSFYFNRTLVIMAFVIKVYILIKFVLFWIKFWL